MKRTSARLQRTVVVTLLAATASVFVAWRGDRMPVAHASFHTDEELFAFRVAADSSLPAGWGTWFSGSGRCSGCHGFDSTGFSMHTPDGVDVNVTDDWRSTMMANSARDPFWRAKVSHEVLVNPAHQAALEDKCLTCHAPQGKYEKYLTGGGPYSMAELHADDSLGIDGVSCVACHRQSPDSLGIMHSGQMKFTVADILWGPYDQVFGAPMASFVGFVPEYGPHVNDGGFCAGCHTLVTETADLSGNPTGDTFVEQATYHEWLNSAFNTVESSEGISCQGCHTPRIEGPVVISANYIFLTPRTPYGLHHFAGGNAFMLKMLRDYIDTLGLTATETQFDSTIARTMRNLQLHSVLLEPGMSARDADTAFIAVKLSNLTGHKFPSGYPARRAWVELVALKPTGDTLFKSGRWGSDWEVEGHDAEYEPHHDVIRQQDQAQIYELVMGDVNGNKTTVLERAKSPLKDNRLTPIGFTTSHPVYDTTLIAGVPPSDIDFNHDGAGVEGSGTDIVHYHVPMNGYTGAVDVRVRVWYQSTTARWNAEMFSFNSPEIDQFRDMFEAADNSPVLVQEASFTDLGVGTDNIQELGVRVFPNPVTNGLLQVVGLSDKVSDIEVFDLKGRLVASTTVQGRRTWQARMPEGAGTYLVVFHARDGRFVERVVVQ
ncbi:MAG: T9SS type A sorting domain-containing protein [Flavobacteriales bacterium]|nr:T9SS type A sorting domain-containing protein [Flavobacteriales bacterium]